ncbi:MAG: TGS domain-containing protein [Deltaproteobacteria bacterium]|nr:TGS domain-containing protein [Deltaproteobacteria bacterium]
MPANLPPQYFEAEQRFRKASTPEDKIEALEEMLAIMPKHKGTDKLKAMLRERISKFRDQAQKKKGAARQKSPYEIEKEGAAQVVIIGPPNTGKSSLVKLITNASPEVADFPHTTHKPTPGMAHYENIQFQLIDTPPVTKDYTDPALTDLIRRADIMVILLDLSADPIQQWEDTMEILHSFRLFSQACIIPENLKKPPKVKKMFVVANKMDRPEDRENLDVFLELSGITLPCMGISSLTGHNIMAFLDKLFSLSEIIRVYTKAPGRKPDMTAPFILPAGSTLLDLAGAVHNDFLHKLKYARVWGKSVREGQMIQKDYILQDGDVVELCI